MTTPTREQVVQWATDSNGQLIRGAHPGMIGFYPTALDNFATLARADLEAIIAEQAAEIERLKKDAVPQGWMLVPRVSSNDMHIAFIHKCGPSDSFYSAYAATIAAAPKQEK